MFVIYPQNARINKIPLINISVQLVGPPALFVVSLTLLWFLYPGPPNRFYLVQKHGKPAEFQLETFEVKPIQGSCAYYPARSQSDRFLLGGLYVEFREDSKCTAQIGNSFETYQVSFGVTDRTNILEVKPN